MIAKLLITIATLIYGFVPLVVDLSDTHVFHPEWTPHARLHMVWLLGTGASLAILSLYLLWVRDQLVLSATLGLCVMTGFWLAVATRGLYGGALTEAGGVDTTTFGIEGNSFAFSIVLALLLAGIALGRNSSVSVDGNH